jgi:hypothetical protein
MQQVFYEAYSNTITQVDILFQPHHGRKSGTVPDNLLKVEATVNGREFATPRGWEDLSIAMSQNHKFGYETNFDTIIQYIQHEEIAKEFSKYLNLYFKYEHSYNIDKIFAGDFSDSQKLMKAKYDEKIAVIEMLSEKAIKEVQKSKKDTLNNIENILKFVQLCFGDGQESCLYMTNCYFSETFVKYIVNNYSLEYIKANKKLLVDNKNKKLFVEVLSLMNE